MNQIPTYTNSDTAKSILEQNPWQLGADILHEFAPKEERLIVPLMSRWLLDARSRHIQVILGPRRVGKTAALYQIIRTLLENGIDASRVFFLRLDRPDIANYSLGDIARHIVQASSATATEPAYLMLDEVIDMEDWDRWLKTFYDENWPLRIVATASSRLGLKMGQLESGIDRWQEQSLLPCRILECYKLLEKEYPHGSQISVEPNLDDTLKGLLRQDSLGRELQKYRDLLITVGGLPGQLTSYIEPEHGQSTLMPTIEALPLFLPHQIQLYENIVEKAVYIDIPKHSGIRNPENLERILYVLAGQMAQLLSPQSISKDLGIPVATINNYLDCLELASLVVLLPNYSPSEVKTQRRGRKIYFIDTALRNAILRRNVSLSSDLIEYGHAIENLVVSSLQSLAEQTRFRLYYWRNSKHEVDVIYDDVNGPLAFEVGLSSNHSLSGLSALIEKHPKFHGNSYLISPQPDFIAAQTSPNGIGKLPLDLFLLVVDLQASYALKRRFGY